MRPAFANSFANPSPQTHTILEPQNNSFPSGPIDIKPRAVPPPKFCYGSQVFGKRNEDKPVPMHTRNTIRPPVNNFQNNNFRNNNNFRQTNRQLNFTFEEIHNTQADYKENEFFNEQINEEFLEEEIEPQQNFQETASHSRQT
jgi:hypothetical protein